jgi:hypothetical protein
VEQAPEAAPAVQVRARVLALAVTALVPALAREPVPAAQEPVLARVLALVVTAPGRVPAQEPVPAAQEREPVLVQEPVAAAPAAELVPVAEMAARAQVRRLVWALVAMRQAPAQALAREPPVLARGAMPVWALAA